MIFVPSNHVIFNTFYVIWKVNNIKFWEKLFHITLKHFNTENNTYIMKLDSSSLPSRTRITHDLLTTERACICNKLIRRTNLCSQHFYSFFPWYHLHGTMYPATSKKWPINIWVYKNAASKDRPLGTFPNGGKIFSNESFRKKKHLNTIV